MPFFTSRIDHKLCDDEKHLSARSLSSSICYGSSRFNLSSRSCDISMSSVRHVNSAPFIENNIPLRDVLSEDNVRCGNMSETQSDIVPPLDIKSEENYPTTRDYTFSYRKHCEGGNIVLKPENAFETWLSAKRKLLSDEAARRKNEEELKQKEMEERKRLAKEKYDLWLQKKLQSSISLPSITSSIKNETNIEIRTRSKLPSEEVRARLDAWEREKRLKEEHRRMLKRQKEQHRRELEEQRRQMAVEAWENWVANANKKPKPVPLNRGIFTLRGTVSDIFVNPNEWKPVIQMNHENNQ